MGASISLALAVGLVCLFAFYLDHAWTNMKEQVEKGMDSVVADYEKRFQKVFEENREKDRKLMEQGMDSVAVTYWKQFEKMFEENRAREGELMDDVVDSVVGKYEERMGSLFDENSDRERRLVEEILEMARNELDANDGLKSRIGTLEAENSALTVELAKTRQNERDIRTKLTKLIISVDRERQELKAKEKLLDDALAKCSDVEEASNGDTGNEGIAAGESDAGEDDSALPGDGVSLVTTHKVKLIDFLSELNAYLKDGSEDGLRVMECEGVEGSSLLKPIIQVDLFMGEGPAVLLPDQVVFSVGENAVNVVCNGGTYIRPESAEKQIPASGMNIASIALASGEELLDKALMSFLGIDFRESKLEVSCETGYSDAGLPHESAMRKLNILLLKERGGKYRFRSVKSLDGNDLVDVVLEQNSAYGVLDKLVEAKKCVVSLKKRDRYVELMFEDGNLVINGKSRPFYNNLYRLPIANIDLDMWMSSSLDYIEVME